MPTAASTGAKGRGGWLVRVLGFWGGYLGILWLASFLKGMIPPAAADLVWGLLCSLALLGLTLLFLRTEGRCVQDVGLDPDRSTPLRFGIGLLVGLGFFALQLVAARVIAGPFQIGLKGAIEPAVVALAVAGTLALAAMEELGFRGYALRTLVSGFGFWGGQAIVAVAFGLCHVLFGWSLSNIVLGVIPAAFVFGMAAVVSRGLAMPLGVHVGVNVAQSAMSGGSRWGVLELTMEEPVRQRLEGAAPWSGVLVALLVVGLLWGVSRRVRKSQR
ncbi:MAG: CPBP family intramembrane metalloprotease [Verrucomicrobiales bacterium]|nr:CPBP family intramembrane metalloprotease [Verrucomicrobiales bacterium]